MTVVVAGDRQRAQLIGAAAAATGCHRVVSLVKDVDYSGTQRAIERYIA